MTGMDFPSSPSNGTQTADGRYYFDSSVGSTGAWRSSPLPVGGLPAGSIMAWGTNTPPANWLLADGSAVSRSVYSSLFAVIGTQYGTGDGTNTFNLPDLRGRVPVGKNAGTFGTLGATGGAETHTLTVAQMPGHSHQVANNDASGPVSFPAYSAMTGYTSTGTTTHNTLAINPAGGDQPHNNLQPYQVVNYIIKTSAGWTAGDSELATRLGVVEATNTTQNTRLTNLENVVLPGAAWTAYTPTLSNITLGNGSMAFYYAKVGRIIHIRGLIIFGSTTTFSGACDFSHPAMSSATQILHPTGFAEFYSGLLYHGRIVRINDTYSRFVCSAISGSRVINSELTNTSPFTWASGNWASVNMTYEAAS